MAKEEAVKDEAAAATPKKGIKWPEDGGAPQEVAEPEVGPKIGEIVDSAMATGGQYEAVGGGKLRRIA